MNDAAIAKRAAAALFALRIAVPPDVALVLARHRRRCPMVPLPPVRVESDPPGAQVSRNLAGLGPTPLWVEGAAVEGATPGQAAATVAADFIDVELPGFRKLHRTLPASGELVLALRPEDRPQVLLERAALQEPGARLRRQSCVRWPSLSLQVATRQPHVRSSSRGRRRRRGQPSLGKHCLPASTTWRSATGWRLRPRSRPAQRRSRVLRWRRCRSSDGSLPAGGFGAGRWQRGQERAGQRRGRGKEAPKKKGLFGNTRWYTWVVAGGVVALIAGLLIAEKSARKSHHLGDALTPTGLPLRSRGSAPRCRVKRLE